MSMCLYSYKEDVEIITIHVVVVVVGFFMLNIWAETFLDVFRPMFKPNQLNFCILSGIISSQVGACSKDSSVGGKT